MVSLCVIGRSYMQKSSHVGFFKTIVRLRESDIVRMAGTDAMVFLVFLKLAAWLLTAIAAPLCLILVPIDVTYKNNEQNDASQNDSQGSNGFHDTFMYFTMGNVHGPRLWAHVILSYLVTVAALCMVYFAYKKVIALRQAYFSSVKYQTSYYSRALMATDLAPDIVDDASLRDTLTSAGIVYPLCEVQLGHGIDDLPQLLETQKQTVYELEYYLDRALRSKTCKRPTVRLNSWYFGHRVDAIDHYSRELDAINEKIYLARSDQTDYAPQSYGFASLAAPMYAHATAKHFSKKQPRNVKIRLASSPNDILWTNLIKSPASRKRSRHFARFLLFLLFVANVFPLLTVSIISNLSAFSRISANLETWQTYHSVSFAIFTGVLPPLITFAFSLLLPMMMRRIAMYRGVRTRQSRDLSLTSQYFTFLMATQLIIFSLISVILDLIIMILSAMHNKLSVSSAFSQISKEILDQVSKRFQFLSAYWITWIILKGYLLLFELAQVRRLSFLMIHRYLFKYNPRRIHNYTKAPHFSYWVIYAEMLFLIAIGLIYAPLAPFVTAVAAGVCWMALFVYKNQLYYVYVTKSESGGRLWSAVVKCLLAMLATMEVIVAIAIGLLQNWAKAVVCIPPIIVIGLFGWYCHAKLEPLFLWHNPSPMDLAHFQVQVYGSDREHLARQFGNVYLHKPLEKPVVDSELIHRVKEFYDGPVVSSKTNNSLELEQEPVLPLKSSRSSSSLDSSDTFDTNADPLPVIDIDSVYGDVFDPKTETQMEREANILHLPSLNKFELDQDGDAYSMVSMMPEPSSTPQAAENKIDAETGTR